MSAAECRQPAGRVAPLVDRNSCEGKAECAAVCPFDVFSIERIRPEDFQRLSLVGKIKSLVHGRRTAYTPHADQCHACGLCVGACPETAIRLAALG